MAKTTSTKSNPVVPANTLSNRRAKLYNAIELDTVRSDFAKNFRVLSGNLYEPFNTAEVRVEISSMNTVELVLRSKHSTPARGIHFDFGVNGLDFHPVIQFMFSDPDTKGDLRLFPEQYHIVNNHLVEIDPTQADSFRTNYRNTCGIRVAKSNLFRRVDSITGLPDPKAEWFPYADNVNKLIRDNEDPKYLVVSCISEMLSYPAIALEDTPDHRHMLALYTASEAGVNLGTNSAPPSGNYRNLAMDLGHLCPPRCKK
ncbi:MAG: hypothetical protein MUE88_09510 [Flavobacteriales bacterium]|jgi:hypothetical protein|nr:hypothetical protein [Flavobacteriales bacterium]